MISLRECRTSHSGVGKWGRVERVIVHDRLGYGTAVGIFDIPYCPVQNTGGEAIEMETSLHATGMILIAYEKGTYICGGQK